MILNPQTARTLFARRCGNAGRDAQPALRLHEKSGAGGFGYVLIVSTYWLEPCGAGRRRRSCRHWSGVSGKKLIADVHPSGRGPTSRNLASSGREWNSHCAAAYITSRWDRCPIGNEQSPINAAMLSADENTSTPAPNLSMRMPNSSGAAAVAARVGTPNSPSR